MDIWHTCASLTFASFTASDRNWCRSGFWKECSLACITPPNSHLVVLILLTSSTIIQEVLFMRQVGSAALAFFYFDHQDTSKLDARSLLTSLLVQLCDQSDSFFEAFSILYGEHDNGARQPEEDALIKCLMNMISRPGQLSIYVILDALDECPNSHRSPSTRKRVLEVLEELINFRHPNLHVCVTSRPEIDIRWVLEPLTDSHVILQDESGQRKDIANYVYHVVHTDPAIQKWPVEEKAFIIDKLMERSNGMYVIVILVAHDTFSCRDLGSNGLPIS